MVSQRRSVAEAPDADAHAPVHALLSLMTPPIKPEQTNEVAVRTVVSKKRNASSSEDDGKQSSSTEGAPPRKPRVRKYRKATHTIRKVRSRLPRVEKAWSHVRVCCVARKRKSCYWISWPSSRPT